MNHKSKTRPRTTRLRTTDSISRATSVIGSRYAWYFNKPYKLTGMIWEGRHKSSLVQSDRNFLSCCRYIEMNPVVSGMVRKPEEYRWSSYRVNAWGAQSRLAIHEEYLKLGASAEERCHAYRELFRFQISDDDVHLIDRASHFSHPVEDERFKKQIEQKYGIKFGQAARGRLIKQAQCG